MRAKLSRAIMTLTDCFLGDSRREWSAAMRAEFDAALDDGKPLSFALGCLGAALRDLPGREEGRFTLSSYGLVLGVMLPMAAFQIGCALFGLPYLHPTQGLSGAMLAGMTEVYQAAIPALTLALLLLGIGHLCIAWAMLDRNWPLVMRLARVAMAAVVTLLVVMSVLFLRIDQMLLQGAILAIELATIMSVAQWHAQLMPPREENPG